MVVINARRRRKLPPLRAAQTPLLHLRACLFLAPRQHHRRESVYETRRRIGVELAREAPVEADLVCPVPDSGTPAAIGYSQESGIPYAMGIIRNQYMGRTFIEPTEQIRNMGVRLKLNVNRALIRGKR
jgi:amidophosphoribosyltransferase